MQVFVTGSTGLVGNNLVRLLVEQGYDVKALARSKEKYNQLLGNVPGVEVVKGDMENVAGFADALAGCDVLMHTAAFFREHSGSAKDWQRLVAINVEATLKLFEEAEKRGVKKVIYISTSGAVGRPAPGVAGTEADAPDPKASSENLYYKSKVLGEAEIARFLKNHKIEVVLVNPSAIIGPGDIGPTPIGKVMQDYLARKAPGILDGGLCFVDARDVAQAMINAIVQGKSGERYILCNEYKSIEEVFQLTEQASGIPAPRRKIPYLAMRLTSSVAEFLSRFTGKPPVVSVNAVKGLHEEWFWSSAKAQRELGATFRPLSESIRDTINWYKANSHGQLQKN